jgi:hypothetical protein
MSKIVVTFQEVPKWPYAKTPKIKTAELQPGQRFYNQSDWLILSVEYQANEVDGDKPETADSLSPEDEAGEWVSWPPWRKLVPGTEYLIRTRTSGQKYAREHRMSFLALDIDRLQFNARPFAGTQVLSPNDIIGHKALGKSAGRDDPKRYMNKVIE